MRSKTKLTLTTNNPNLKTYYVPLARIEVSLYPVKANNFEEAIWKANNGRCESSCKRFVLEETHTNEAYDKTYVPTEVLFAREIQHYELDIKDLRDESKKLKSL